MEKYHTVKMFWPIKKSYLYFNLNIFPLQLPNLLNLQLFTTIWSSTIVLDGVIHHFQEDYTTIIVFAVSKYSSLKALTASH